MSVPGGSYGKLSSFESSNADFGSQHTSSSNGHSDGDQSSVILHHSTGSQNPSTSDDEKNANYETPGRPDDSISEYAEAYVRMMKERESGVPLAGSIITPLPDANDEPIDSAPSSRGSSGLASPSSPASPRLQDAPSRNLSRPPSSDPLPRPQESKPPNGFQPRQSAVSGPVASSSAPERPRTHSRHSSASHSPNELRASLPQNQHRRKPSNTGFVAPIVHPLAFHEEEDLHYQAAIRSRHSQSANKPKNGIRQSLGSHAVVASSGAAAGPQRANHGWHARKGSTASNSSGNSDSPQASSSSLRVSARDLHSSGNSRGSNSSGHANTKNQKAKSTLFYLRRRIHAIRAVSLLMLIGMVTVSLISWIVLLKRLAESQRLRINGCDIETASDVNGLADAMQPATHRCMYFKHDMTPYLAITGIWMAASLSISMINVAAGFMFYWRSFVRIAFSMNISIFLASMIVLNWTIILVAFSYEGENWRYRDNDAIVPYSAYNRAGSVLKTASVSFLVGISIFWFFNFLSVILLHQLRKFVMTKPRYCCWPLDGLCCTDPIRNNYAADDRHLNHPNASVFSIPSNVLLNRQGNPIVHLDHSVELQEVQHPDDDPSSHLEDSMINMDEDHDAFEDKDSGVIISRQKPKNKLSPHPPPPRRSKRQSSSSAQDLTPLISSLQGIQDTVNTLATKVQAIEQREAPVAEPSYSDPFAYGRKPPQF